MGCAVLALAGPVFGLMVSQEVPVLGSGLETPSSAGCFVRYPCTVLHAVPDRIQLMLDGIPAAAAACDPGMANLMAAGEPARSRASQHDLIRRIPAIERHLPSRR